jgi:GT2 family glycosyltransferase
MRISFIVLAWNSGKYLERCFASVAGALRGGALDYEIRVFDNGSTDGTPELLQRLAAADPERIKPQSAATNLGTTRSRNLLCAAATGDYLCVMDSDVELQAGVVEALIRILQTEPRTGIVAPRVNYPDGRWQKSFDRFPTVLAKLNRFARLRAMERDEAEGVRDAVEPFDVDYAISAFWLMRKSLFEEVGPLDERIFYAPEDVDYCLRVWKANYRILYVPTVAVVHHTQEISRGFRLNRAKLEHIRGLAYFFRKHGCFLRRPVFRSVRMAPASGDGPLQS